MLIMKKTNEASTLPRYKSQGNMHLFKVEGEKNDMPSTTTPNLAYTPKEIYQRMTRNIPVHGEKFPVFDEDNEIAVPDPRFVSKLSLAEMEVHYRDELQSIRDRQNKRIQAEKEKLERDRKIAEAKAKKEREEALNRVIDKEKSEGSKK